MAYRRLRGIPGKLYVPDPEPTQKKHPCKDCFACQWCSDNRCECCRLKKSTTPKKP